MKKISNKVIKKFFNLIEDSREFYKDFLRTDKGDIYIPEIYLEMQEFIHVNEKYSQTFNNKLESDLSFTDYNYLYCIGSSEKINLTQLSKKIKNSKGYTSKVIKKLLTLNYITTFQEEGNKKDIYLELTKSGKKVFEDVCRRIEETEENFYSFLNKNFNEEELKIIYNFFIKINKFQNEEIMKG